MAAHEYGDSLTSATTEKVVYERTATGNRKTETLVCDWASRASNTPAIGTTSESMALLSASQEQLPADLCRITLVYENSTFEESLPSTTYDETTSTVELDIKQHPNFEDWSSEWDTEKEAFKPDSDKYGITSFIVGSTVVTKTEYFASSPSSRYDEVGTLEAPGGGYSGSSNWLIIGSTRRKLGDDLYTRETQYLYSAKEYPSDIYS